MMIEKVSQTPNHDPTYWSEAPPSLERMSLNLTGYLKKSRRLSKYRLFKEILHIYIYLLL